MKVLIRLPFLFLIMWGVLTGLAMGVRLSPDWPLWAVALAGAVAVELMLALYRYEAAAVTPRRAGWMVTLRLMALAVLGWILIEPVWVRSVEREPRREVVVVVDDSASMHLTDEGATASRQDLGMEGIDESGMLARLRESVNVRTVRAARGVRTAGEEETAGWDSATDLATALGTVLEQVPPDSLAGVILVSDGRHNRPGSVEDVARRFGILDAPVGVVASGSDDPPRDAAVVEVRAPEAIHLGDRMRVSADLKIDGYRGAEAKVRLTRGGKLLDERVVAVPQDRHREELRFVTVPEEDGVGGFRIEIAALEGERFADNNAWDFETSITDARTNVLIVEGVPRWEFRYLRNLFYGRDKSVHLQHVLLHPDRIDGQEDEAIPASASRPFGESRATRLPATEEEWRKFDVIILGDIEPQAIDDATWRILADCVRERAALLVMIAGPRFMPHGIVSETGRGLVPAETYEGSRGFYSAGGDPFRFALTAEGRGHEVTRQTAGDTANDAVWAGFPVLRWRQPIRGLKEGAEVLLTASGQGEEAGIRSGRDVNAALAELVRRREREAAAALLVTRQTGRGKVALLLTDRTWRLREGAGDVFHHRFWGNLVRWGAGPVLRAGGSRVRLGTDQLTYTADDRIEVTARLRDTDLNPVVDGELKAELLRDGEVIGSVPLVPLEGSNGLHQAEMGPIGNAGRYHIRLRGPAADRLAAEDGAANVSAGVRVVGSRGPVELADTTLNLALLQTVADLSGGKVVGPEAAGELAGLFLKDDATRRELRETPLWDNGWVLGLFAMLLAGEWLTRRGGGLP